MKFFAYTIIIFVAAIFLSLSFLITRYAVIHENNFYLASLLFGDIAHPKKAEIALAQANLGEADFQFAETVTTPLDFCPPNFKPKSLRVRVSIVDFLNINDFDSSFSERAELAKMFDMPDYRGTAKENLKMLELLKSDAESCSLSS